MLLVKWIRLSRRQVQKEVARKTHIIQNYLSQIENGVRVPQGDELAKLAKFYNCDPARLLTHVADPGDGLAHLDAEARHTSVGCRATTKSVRQVPA